MTIDVGRDYFPHPRLLMLCLMALGMAREFDAHWGELAWALAVDGGAPWAKA